MPFGAWYVEMYTFFRTDDVKCCFPQPISHFHNRLRKREVKVKGALVWPWFAFLGVRKRSTGYSLGCPVMWNFILCLGCLRYGIHHWEPPFLCSEKQSPIMCPAHLGGKQKPGSQDLVGVYDLSVRHTHIQHVWNLTNGCYVGSKLLESTLVALPRVLYLATLSWDEILFSLEQLIWRCNCARLDGRICTLVLWELAE